jgi:hypothetical protein
MAMKYNSENSGHNDSLEVGNTFEDFVCIELAKQNIILQNIHSKKFQYETGENLQGFEIKYDARSMGCNGTKATGNVSIEVAEKTRKENKNFVPSGIYRGDNAWLYITGNYLAFWIFSVKILRGLHNTGKYKEWEPRPTIRTFLIPISVADKYCAKKFEFTH